jgi:hypothetical protein
VQLLTDALIQEFEDDTANIANTLYDIKLRLVETMQRYQQNEIKEEDSPSEPVSRQILPSKIV